MATEKTKTTLDKKSIAAIADQLETRMRGGDSAPVDSQKASSTGGHRSKSVFIWGALSGVAVAGAAPLLGKQARPAVRGVIKGGILTGRYVQKIASNAKEDIQDLSAEASADLDAEDNGPNPDSGSAKRRGK